MENTSLSDREIEILQLVGQGMSNKEIAANLFISINTVKVHMGNIFHKIGVASRTEATLFAIEHGIIASPAGANNPEGQAAAGDLPAPGPVALFLKRFWWLAAGLGLLLVLGLSALLAQSPLLAPTAPTSNPMLGSLGANRWEELAPLPQPRTEMAAIAYENALYAIGGRSEQGPSALVERYDPLSNSWAALQDKPTAVSAVSAVVIGEKFYLPGGELKGGEPSSVLEVYDPRKDSWESKAPLPLPLSAYALAAYEGQIYLFGGWDGQQVVNAVWRYNPLEDAWYPCTPMPTARAYAGAAEAAGKIYVMGGRNGELAVEANESFNPARALSGEAAWEQETDAVPSCGNCSANSSSNMLFVVKSDGIWQFSLTDKAWIQITSGLPGHGTGKLSSAISSDGYLYLLGGFGEDGSPSDSLSRFRVIYTISIPSVINQDN